MTKIKYIYENKEYNNILEQILSKNITINDINKYYNNKDLSKRENKNYRLFN